MQFFPADQIRFFQRTGQATGELVGNAIVDIGNQGHKLISARTPNDVA